MQEREQDLEQELSEARQQLAEARAREQDLERRLAETSADNRDLDWWGRPSPWTLLSSWGSPSLWNPPCS